MVEYENQCVGCPPELGCLGKTCPNRNVPIFRCDECGDECGELQKYYGKELCAGCYAMAAEESEDDNV